MQYGRCLLGVKITAMVRDEKIKGSEPEKNDSEPEF